MNKILYLASLPVLVAAAGSVAAQGFPAKPLRLVTSEVGGSADTGARLVTKRMA